MSLGRPWEVCGVPSGCPRNARHPHGISLKSGMCSGFFWDVFGTSLGRPWDVCGAFLGRLWDVLGTRLGRHWD
eukprot:4102394-Lingulodinium_polyedra.AAC.1